MMLVTTLGVGLWLAALNVAYRDVRYALAFLVQFWLFATPIAFSSSLVHGHWRTVLGLNPMAGVVEGFRWGLLDTSNTSFSLMLVSAVVSLVLLVSGYSYFRRVEDGFADII
jgi:lipopolysaccharide transport system permease protein